MKRYSRFAWISATGVYGVLWIGGIASSALRGEAPETAAWAAPAFLYLASTLVIANSSARPALLLLGAGIYGFGAEVLGSATGFPFGEYEYTSTLGPTLFDVPYALASAWIVVTASAVYALGRLEIPRRWWIVVGPMVMVLIDLLLEPAATGPVDAWMWDSTGAYYGVPITNFAGWFLVSVPIFAIFSLSWRSHSSGAVYALSVIAFFIGLSVVHVLWGPLLIFTAAVAIGSYRHWNRDL